MTASLMIGTGVALGLLHSPLGQHANKILGASLLGGGAALLACNEETLKKGVRVAKNILQHVMPPLYIASGLLQGWQVIQLSRGLQRSQLISPPVIGTLLLGLVNTLFYVKLGLFVRSLINEDRMSKFLISIKNNFNDSDIEKKFEAWEYLGFLDIQLQFTKMIMPMKEIFEQAFLEIAFDKKAGLCTKEKIQRALHYLSFLLEKPYRAEFFKELKRYPQIYKLTCEVIKELKPQVPQEPPPPPKPPRLTLLELAEQSLTPIIHLCFAPRTTLLGMGLGLFFSHEVKTPLALANLALDSLAPPQLQSKIAKIGHFTSGLFFTISLKDYLFAD